MARPSPPTSVIVHAIADAGVPIVTKVVGPNMNASAIIDDPDAGQKVRLVVRYSSDPLFAHYKEVASGLHTQGLRVTVTMSGLAKNTLYYARAYTKDAAGNWSASYNGFRFWMDRLPSPPDLVSPVDNAAEDASAAILFDWTPHDPDETDPAPTSGWQLRWRIAAEPLLPAGPWVYKTVGDSATSYSMPANTFKRATVYEWQARTRDPQLVWGEFSVMRSFTTEGLSGTPLGVSPGGDIAVTTDTDTVFAWQFRDPTPGAVQLNADIRYRVVGTTTWTTIAGAAVADTFTTVAASTFLPGYHYEWEVQTTRDSGPDPVSDWSDPMRFWTILTPGSLATLSDVLGDQVRGKLGCGRHRAFLFDKGGLVNRGEITKWTSINWGRLRDDIASAQVSVDSYDSDMADLLGQARSWIHELVIYRESEEGSERVFEGPLVHREMTDDYGPVTFTAKDVMGYVYRRVLRQGYNDSYHLVNGNQLGLLTVVERAGRIIVNCLSYADPNVLPYLTRIETGEDARQTRIIPDYTKTAWEEIDDMASNAGLDYTTVGRRIMLWDTHTPIGQLPEMRAGDFTEPLIVTEYGMAAANYFAVTDGQGTWGAAIPDGTTEDDWFQSYGPLEQLATGYGDTAVPAAVATDSAALAAQVEQLTSQARRNINGRWPVPMVARIPDNAGVSPKANVTINQLVPGVWVPLRVARTVQPFTQMQKLDSLTVSQNAEEDEKIRVVLSPAPRGAQDPDAVTTDDGGAGSGA